MPNGVGDKLRHCHTPTTLCAWATSSTGLAVLPMKPMKDRKKTVVKVLNALFMMVSLHGGCG
jgi:hypothetical protein